MFLGQLCSPVKKGSTEVPPPAAVMTKELPKLQQRRLMKVCAPRPHSSSVPQQHCMQATPV